tara:strand:+ start:384 stop:1229 length:846 start_codon:yes stop_codon:yes gene_type:complete
MLNYILCIILIVFLINLYYFLNKSKENFSKIIVSKPKKLKFCICFFGVISRSIKYTINSIDKNIYKVLERNNIKYDVYVHNMKIDKILSLQEGEKDIKLSDECKLLRPTYFRETNQNDFDKTYNWEKNSIYGLVRDNYNLYQNAIRQIYSVDQVTKMWQEKNINYDYYIYVRPDLLYAKELDLDLILETMNKDILLTPKWHKWGGLNDRIYMSNKNIIKNFGNRIKHVDEYVSKNKIKYHPEKFMKYIAIKFKIKTLDIDLIGKRVRSNGKINEKDDIELK